MKILDRYVAKNFLTGYIIAFCVLIGLRVMIELFVNIDEFAEHSNLGTMVVLKNIISYYAINSTVYFRDFAGMILVVAAAFSLGKMIKNNELVAIMGSGVSLKRVIAPILILAIIITSIDIINQECTIPSLAEKLARSEDDLPGEESYNVRFISDSKGSLLCTSEFEVKDSSLLKPTIILRKPHPNSTWWEVTGRIDAKKAVYNFKKKRWDLIKGYLTEKGFDKGRQPISYYVSDITPKDIAIRQKSENKSLLSYSQLSKLANQKHKIKDLAQLYSEKHFRITNPIMNLVILMISLPILVCRDPKTMKSSIMTSFTLTGACMVTNFLCRLFSTEIFFGTVRPEIWAWLPVFIFLPIAFIEIDSMKT